MSSEDLTHIEKKIIEAAENHFPPYNESAWPKMKALLDKHMPEKERKRRVIFFILLFLLLGTGGAYLLVSRPWQSGKSKTVRVEYSQPAGQDQPADKKNQQEINPNKENTSPPSDSGPMENKVVSFDKKNEIPEINLQLKEKEETYRQKDGYPNYNKKTKLPLAGARPADDAHKNKNNRLTGNENELVRKKEKNISGPDAVGKEKEALQKPAETESLSVTEKEPEQLKPEADRAASQKDNSAKKETETSKVDPANIKAHGKIRKSSSLFISLAAGPDLSAAGTKEIGKFRLAYGGLIGFTYREKLTLKTGVVSVRKIYSASPEAYNPPPAFWNYYPNLKQVEADCSVIEIPALLSYHFPASKKHSYAVTAGLSSYLMKRETYDYYYINASGQPAHRKYTFRDINKHYFSVLTLAGGYQRKINNRLSFSLEPYIKVPLEGIGYGKVHLNSAGLLFTTDLNILKSAAKQKQ